MAAITEDYVSFETAKLLQEKGFNEPCLKQYYNNSELSNVSIEAKYNTIVNQVSAPTLQMAMKWLRETHNIHIELNWEKGNKLYSFQIWKPGKYQPEISSLELWRIYKDDNYPGEWKYEEACETAIKYCLENLI